MKETVPQFRLSGFRQIKFNKLWVYNIDNNYNNNKSAKTEGSEPLSMRVNKNNKFKWPRTSIILAIKYRIYYVYV